MLNLYRQPRPARSQVVAKGRFYAADENGRRTSSYAQPLLLSRTYLWVTESLTIPLESIIDLGSTKRGGFIRFGDYLDGATREIHFTFPGFLRPRLDKVASFLAAVDVQRGIRVQELQTSDQLDPVEPSCERCDDTMADFYVFRTFKFVGFAPFAYSYSLVPGRYLLCRSHAVEQAFKNNCKTAIFGYLGFPGFIAAPYYVVRNLVELRRNHALSANALAGSLLVAIVVPLGIVVVPVVVVVRWALAP